MKIEKRYLYLSDAEWRVLLLALNKMRSKLIAQGRYTDAVDEIILKMAGYWTMDSEPRRATSRFLSSSPRTSASSPQPVSPTGYRVWSR